jgi:hypothetical protein
MKVVAPPEPRSKVVETVHGLSITVPARRQVFVVGFLSLWLIGWAMGEKYAVGQLFDALRGYATDEPLGFLLLWLAIWTFGGAFALLVVLWSIFGRERLVLTRGRLLLRRELLGLCRMRAYDLSQVRNIRVSPVHQGPFGWRSSGQSFGLGGGLVAFDYGSSTVRFADSIDEGEAEQLVSAITEHRLFPGSAPAA